MLTSVHAFAEDPRRGELILLMILLSTGGALALYAIRSPKLRTGPSYALISRESGLVLNNVLLVVALFTVVLGTFYPLILDTVGADKISVGRPYYARTFIPIVTPLLLAIAVGPVLRWKRDNLKDALKRLNKAALAAGLVALLVLAVTLGRELVAAFFLAIATWIIFGSFVALAQRVRLGVVPLTTTLRLLGSTPRAYYGLVAAHAGVGVLVMGIAGMSTWATEHIGTLHIGQSFELSGYELRLQGVDEVQGPNYQAQRARFDVLRRGRFFTHLQSERRFYPVRQQETTAAGIRTNLITNLYVALGDDDGAGGWAVRFYYHPFMPLVWIGALVMAAGGFISLSDRRFRVGAVRRPAVALRPPLDMAPAE